MADTRLADQLRQIDGREMMIRLSYQTLEGYFFAVSDMLGDGHFDDVYNQMKPSLEEDVSVCRFLHQLPHTLERSNLLYQVLIEPFAAMEGENDDDDDDDDA